MTITATIPLTISINMHQFSPTVRKVEQYATSMLKNRVNPRFIYHNYAHTLETVKASIIIGKGVGLPLEQLEIVVIAAWLHDIGYIYSWKNHEYLSAQIATNLLYEMQYPSAKIEQVANCIKATKVPQSPKNMMEKVLCDADLVNLGIPQHFERSALLRREWAITRNQVFNEIEWQEYSIQFLSEQQYHTMFAQQWLNPQKQAHLQHRKQLLQELIVRQSKSVKISSTA